MPVAGSQNSGGLCCDATQVNADQSAESDPSSCCEPSLKGDLSCCNFYAQDWVRDLLGECFHPGGEALSRRTVAAMGLPRGAVLADLGCGSGSSALLLAEAFALQVYGLDLNSENLERARKRAHTAGLLHKEAEVHDFEVNGFKEAPADAQDASGVVSFHRADTAQLPFADASLHACLCECTLSLFPNQTQTLRDIYRCLQVGGQLGVTDMALAGPIAADLQAVIGPWACLNGALEEDAYLRLFTTTGFVIKVQADESQTLLDLLAQLKRRFLVLGAAQHLGLATGVGFPELDLAQIKHYLDRCREEVQAGHIRYLRFNLQRTP